MLLSQREVLDRLMIYLPSNETWREKWAHHFQTLAQTIDLARARLAREYREVALSAR